MKSSLIYYLSEAGTMKTTECAGKKDARPDCCEILLRKKEEEDHSSSKPANNIPSKCVWKKPHDESDTRHGRSFHIDSSNGYNVWTNTALVDEIMQFLDIKSTQEFLVSVALSSKKHPTVYVELSRRRSAVLELAQQLVPLWTTSFIVSRQNDRRAAELLRQVDDILGLSSPFWLKCCHVKFSTKCIVNAAVEHEHILNMRAFVLPSIFFSPIVDEKDPDLCVMTTRQQDDLKRLFVTMLHEYCVQYNGERTTWRQLDLNRLGPHVIAHCPLRAEIFRSVARFQAWRQPQLRDGFESALRLVFQYGNDCRLTEDADYDQVLSDTVHMWYPRHS